jgi:inward rectifier potassium channel
MELQYMEVNPENDLGFGAHPVIKSQPLVNKDGSPNVRQIGLPKFSTANNYQTLITMSWTKFWLLVVLTYFAVNVIFALIYMSFGRASLEGTSGNVTLSFFLDAFYFSAQTLSTVGYGHISPRGIGANSVAALESMLGLLAFAVAAGLLYGRFSRPSAEIVFSRNLVVAPYLENGKGLMFRLANLRRNILIDLEIEVIFSYNELADGKLIRRFYPLLLERRKVSMLTINWTVVHPLNEHSPLKDYTIAQLNEMDATFSILLKAFDDTFSQTVNARTSYESEDMIWGAKFAPVVERDHEGRIVLDVSRISDYDELNWKSAHN